MTRFYDDIMLQIMMMAMRMMRIMGHTAVTHTMIITVCLRVPLLNSPSTETIVLTPHSLIIWAEKMNTRFPRRQRQITMRISWIIPQIIRNLISVTNKKVTVIVIFWFRKAKIQNLIWNLKNKYENAYDCRIISDFCGPTNMTSINSMCQYSCNHKNLFQVSVDI